jgi:hypothetical protein
MSWLKKTKDFDRTGPSAKQNCTFVKIGKLAKPNR